MESNVTLLLSYFLNLGRACLFVFNIKKWLFYKCKKPFHTKSEMNTAQAEGNVNSRLYSRGRSSNKSHEEYDAGEESSIYFFYFLLSIVELDLRRSVAKTLVNKIIFVLFNI